MHVSVTIPTFNRASFIAATIESLLSQTHQDWDLQIVDDASTDATVTVVERYLGDSRVRLVRNEENLGLTRNWSKCLGLASGPLVQVLQSDDLIDADYLELVTSAFEEHPNLGFVASNCRHIDARGQVINPGQPTDSRYCRAGDEAVSWFLVNGFPHVSGIVAKRELLDRVGGPREKFWFAPDLEMDARLGSASDYLYFGGMHTSFRRHGTNSGILEFLRRDYVEAYIDLLSAAWAFLGADGVKKLGVSDVRTHVLGQAAELVLGGAAFMVAFDRVAFARHYLEAVRRLAPARSRSTRYMRLKLLSHLGPIGVAVAKRRLGVTRSDQDKFLEAEESLRRKGLLLQPRGRRNERSSF
jgi:glycosyltransferase involved in cell wall biosynthesis